MSLVNRVVARPITWLVAFALLMGLGAYMLTLLPVDQFPEMDPPLIMVSTSYPGVSPGIVEQNLTRVLENALAGVSKVTDLSSTSSRGSSLITLEFNWGTDLSEATDDVRDALERIGDVLPDGAGSPAILKFNRDSMPILRLAVKGDRSADELYKLAVDSIQARLERIEGVATSSVQGGRERQVRVEIPQDRLEAYGVSLTSVASALGRQNMQGSGGELVEGNLSFTVTTAGEFLSLEDIENTVVTTAGGAEVRLHDLADVGWGYEQAASSVYVDGQPGTYIQVMKQSGANSIEVADRVKEAMKTINRQLPAGVELQVVQDTTTLVRGIMSQVLSSVYEGTLLTVLVLLPFLRRLRTTLIISLSIPASILTTVIGMYLLGIGFNMISLTGIILALGMVVDNAIVVLENIISYRERGAKLGPAAVLGSREMMAAISGSTLTTVCVFLPLVLFQNRLDMIGQLVKDLSFTIVIALLASLLVAVTLVPVLASHTLPVVTSRQKPVRNALLRIVDLVLGGAVSGLQQAYAAAIGFVLRVRWLTVILSFGACAAVFLLVPRVGFQFMPFSEDDTVQLSVTLPPGTTLQGTEQVMLRLEQIARSEIKGYSNLVVTAGSRQSMFSSSNTNSGSLLVNLTLEPGGDSSSAAQAKLRRHRGEFPDATFAFGQFRGMGGSEVDVAVYTDDLDRALAAAGTIKGLIEKNLPMVNELEVGLDQGLPQLQVTVDRQRAFDLGVSMSAVTAEVDAAVDGETATIFREGGDEYEVVVILDEGSRKDTSDLERIFVTNASGRRIPLAGIATLTRTTGPVSIKRENQQRVVHVTGSLGPGARASAIEAEVQKLVGASIVQDDGLRIEHVGSMSDLGSTGRELAIIALMAVALVFGVMAVQFQSFKGPFIILLAIPLLFIGVVLIYAWTGEAFSIFSGIGVVVLIGIVVNNGIVLVDFVNLLRGRGMSIRRACIEAGRSRLRPILMTTVTTIVGMLPMAILPGAGSEQVKPIAITIMGGLTTSTFITLFLVPALYSLFYGMKREERRAAAGVGQLQLLGREVRE